MNTYTFIQSLLTLHIAGLVLMAGTTLVDFSTFRTFWKFMDQGQEKPVGLLAATEKFSRLIGIGAALMILTGVGMMALTHGVWGEQLWFRIKFALVIVVILNGLLFGRRQGIKLRKAVAGNGAELAMIRTNLNRFYLIQLALFFTIIFLSVFKFN